MRWTLVIILALIILLASYTVWPFYNPYRIASAVETRNSAALQELVDFPSLRASLAHEMGIGICRSIAVVGSCGSLCGEQFGQRMADLAQRGLQRRKLLCSRSC
jgi:Protein of unknown function (DUF2939)